MAEFKVNIQRLESGIQQLERLEPELASCREDTVRVRSSLQMEMLQRERLNSRLSQAARDLQDCRAALQRVGRTGHQVVQLYRENESQLAQMNPEESSTAAGGEDSEMSFWERLVAFFHGQIYGEDNHGAYEIDSVLYDRDGDYGGNQGGPMGTRGAERQQLYGLIHEYYPEMTDSEMDTYLRKLNSEGCGYTAVINTIFAAYIGHEEAFQRDFGFPMYGEDGDLNYNALLVDFYAATDNHHGGIFNTDRYNSQEDPAADDGFGTRPGDRKYRLEYYLKQNNASVDVKVKTNAKVTPGKYEEMAEDGTVVINLNNGYIYDEDGNQHAIDGGHSMVVTGVTDDGRYVVSSWGHKYYLDPNENRSPNKDRTTISYEYYQYQYK